MIEGVVKRMISGTMNISYVLVSVCIISAREQSAV